MSKNKKLLSLWDGSNPKESARKILEQKPEIVIHYNNEAGPWQYSVVLKDTDLWLDSFKKLDDAYEFVRIYGITPLYQADR